MELLNIYVDDLRQLPNNYTRLFTTGEEFIDYLLERSFTHINHLSLDHDLGEGLLTGYDVCKQVIDLIHDKRVQVEEFHYHTANPTGHKNMLQYTLNAQKHGVISSSVYIDHRFTGF